MHHLILCVLYVHYYIYNKFIFDVNYLKMYYIIMLALLKGTFPH